MKCSTEWTEVWNVLLEKSNVRQYKVDASRMVVTKKTCRVKQLFFGSKEVEKFEERLLLSEQQYRKHLATQTCPEQEGMESGKGLKEAPCVTKWMQIVDSSIIQCTFKKGYVLKAHHGNMISNLGNTIECSKEYQKGLCITRNYEAISFIPNDEVSKDFTEVGNYQAIQLGTHLMIGAIGFSADIGEKMKTEKQYQRNGFQMTRLTSNETVNQAVGSLDQTIEAVRQELLTKLNFLSDRLTLKTHKIDSLCEALQLSLDMVQGLALTDPTTYARKMLNNQYLIADSDHITDSFLRVTPCKKIEDINFRELKGKFCYSDVPVYYRHETGSPQEEGFLNIKSNVISRTSAKISCENQADKFFEMNNQVYVYHPNTTPHRLNTTMALDVPIFKTDIYDDLFHFPDEFIYNETDIIQVDETKATVEYLNDKIQEMDNRVKDVEHLASPEKSLLGFAYVTAKMEHILAGCMEWITRIGAICGLIWAIKNLRGSRWHQNIPHIQVKLTQRHNRSINEETEDLAPTVISQ